MSENTGKDLQKIRGIGEVLAQRLMEAGLDSYEKISAAGEEGLRSIRGMNPRAVPGILAQAAEFGKTAGETREDRIARLKAEAGDLRQNVSALAEEARERFGENLQGKKGRRLEKEIFRLLDTLGRMEDGQQLPPKRSARALAKARRRLDGLDQAGMKKTRKGLKRARRTLQRATG